MVVHPSVVADWRRSTLAYWRNRRDELATEEAALHKRLNPRVETVIREKNVLVFKELLAKVGFPNADLFVHQLTTGFPLTGVFPRTDVMPQVEREATTEVQDLWRRADLIRREVTAGCSSCGDDYLDAELWRLTEAEVAKGWLMGSAWTE